MSVVAPIQVLVRVVKRPRSSQGERLAVFLDTRTSTDPSVVVYSLTTDQWRVEVHQDLVARTRPANTLERAEAREALAFVGPVAVLGSASRIKPSTSNNDNDR